jgi:2-dehydropantoate 2-reductase
MKLTTKRILIFGAGVIGSTFGGRMALQGHNVTFLARNRRLDDLMNSGLLLQRMGHKQLQNITVNVIPELEETDNYDYIFVCLRNEQVASALPILAKNRSGNIVFMVNTPSGYSDWTDALGSERVIPAFPGSGGKIENGIVHYEIVSRIIQPTTIGEISGAKTARILELRQLLCEAGFPTSISKNMDAWQKTHVAMVGPIGDVIYLDGGDNYSVAKNREAINHMNLALKENFRFLKKSGIGIVPRKFYFFIFTPLWFLNRIMSLAFNTRWAETFISNHALNAREEMRVISLKFLEMAKERGFELKEFKKIVNLI